MSKDKPPQVTRAPEPISTVSGGGGYVPPGRPAFIPSGLLWLPDAVKASGSSDELRRAIDNGAVSVTEIMTRTGQSRLVPAHLCRSDDWWRRASRIGRAGNWSDESVLYAGEGQVKALESRGYRTARPVAGRPETERWYEARVQSWPADQPPPSRDDDLEAARAKFGDRVTVERVRSLRRELAPSDWQRQGRPKGGSKTGGVKTGGN